MSNDIRTPAQLRAVAAQIRQSAEYAQGQTRRDELAEAQELEQRADELERD